MLQVRTKFPRTWFIRSNIALDMGFPEVSDVTIILHSYWIMDLLNSWSITSDTWWCVTYIGAGYLDIHVVSTKSAINIVILLLYYVLSNHSVTKSITVMYFKFNFIYPPLYVWQRAKLYLPRVYPIVFSQLPYRVCQ